jgi:hypothetical protein
MIPKSLHTVTVLVAVAQQIACYESFYDNKILIERAANILGYQGVADVHELKAQAVKKLNKLRPGYITLAKVA